MRSPLYCLSFLLALRHAAKNALMRWFFGGPSVAETEPRQGLDRGQHAPVAGLAERVISYVASFVI